MFKLTFENVLFGQARNLRAGSWYNVASCSIPDHQIVGLLVSRFQYLLHMTYVAVTTIFTSFAH